MNELQVFTYQSSEVRTVTKGGEPWFVLKDVCAVLGVVDHKSVVRRLDDDEKGVAQILPLGGKGGAQETTIINESGLYSVILRSDKPEAKPFRKWVTSQVLPSIRKTGAYSTNALPDSTREKLAEARMNNSIARRKSSEAKKAEIWLKLAQVNPVPTYQQICAHYASAELTGGEAVLPLPAVTEKTYSAAEVGTMLGGISANMIGRVANQNGLKSPEYGMEVWDKAKSSAKQVPTWRYNDKAVERLKEILGEGATA